MWTREEKNAYARSYYRKHREQYSKQHREYHKNHPSQRMLVRAKIRAKKKGIPFTITQKDIIVPNICPILGLPLIHSEGPKGTSSNDNSPSLDRIIPKLGYIPGNIAVISMRANRIKTDATPEELRKVADWLESVQ